MDGNWFIIACAIAFRLAGMETDPATDSWKRILLLDQMPCPFKIFLRYLRYESNDIISHRTSGTAGGCLVFIKGTRCSPRPCLIPVHIPQRNGNIRHFRDMFEYDLVCHFSQPNMDLQGAMRVTKTEVCSVSWVYRVSRVNPKNSTNSTNRANLSPTLRSMLNPLCRLKLHFLKGLSCGLYVLILLSWNFFTDGQCNGIDSYKTRHLRKGS